MWAIGRGELKLSRRALRASTPVQIGWLLYRSVEAERGKTEFWLDKLDELIASVKQQMYDMNRDHEKSPNLEREHFRVYSIKAKDPVGPTVPVTPPTDEARLKALLDARAEMNAKRDWTDGLKQRRENMRRGKHRE